jgi:hypothetical protein
MRFIDYAESSFPFMLPNRECSYRQYNRIRYRTPIAKTSRRNTCAALGIRKYFVLTNFKASISGSDIFGAPVSGRFCLAACNIRRSDATKILEAEPNTCVKALAKVSLKRNEWLDRRRVGLDFQPQLPGGPLDVGKTAGVLWLLVPSSPGSTFAETVRQIAR